MPLLLMTLVGVFFSFWSLLESTELSLFFLLPPSIFSLVCLLVESEANLFFLFVTNK